MTELEKAQHDAAVTHARAHADPLVRQAVTALEEGNAVLQMQLAQVSRDRFRASIVAGRMLIAFTIAFALVTGAMWWRYGSEPASFRQGAREGFAASGATEAVRTAIADRASDTLAPPLTPPVKITPSTVTVPARR